MCKCIEGILKVLLFIFNFLLLVAGIGLIVIGAVVAAEFGKFAREELFEQRYLWGTVGVAITIGLLLVLVGVFGIGGLCCKKKALLIGFIVLLIVIIILEIAVMVLVFVYKDEGEDSAKTSIASLLNTTYSGGESKTRDVLNELQDKFDCCGGFNISDYEGVTGGVPGSCCRVSNCTGVAVNGTYYWTRGCGERLFDEIGDLGVGVFVIAIIIALFQFIGIILACKYLNEDDSKHV